MRDGMEAPDTPDNSAGIAIAARIGASLASSPVFGVAVAQKKVRATHCIQTGKRYA